MIPKNIWQTYKDSVPLPARSLVESWRELNSGWKYSYFTDIEIDAFLEKHFDEELVAAFRGMPLGVMRADIWRYAVLYVHGGIYTDIDTQCVAPLDSWLPLSKELVVGLENQTHFCQWTISAAPGHGALKRTLDLVRSRWAAGIDMSYPHFVHYHTGPGVWTDALNQYMNRPNSLAVDTFESLYSSSGSILLLDENAFRNTLVRHVFASRAWRGITTYQSWLDLR